MTTAAARDGLRALTFDVFGTVVDWRTSVIREVRLFAERHGLDVDPAAFADAWRGLYQPAMEAVRAGRRTWVPLDVLHRESLSVLAARFGLDPVDPSALDELNLVWHRLRPWPDAVRGLTRLAARYRLATLSNGNVALMEDLAAFGGLPWDDVLGAEPTRSYKPMPEAYRGSARLMGLRPDECMHVAAHNDDLRAAGALGFRTAFVARPLEHGPDQRSDLRPEEAWDLAAADLEHLARLLAV